MPDMPAGTLETERPVPGIVPPVFRSKGLESLKRSLTCWKRKQSKSMLYLEEIPFFQIRVYS